MVLSGPWCFNWVEPAAIPQGSLLQSVIHVLKRSNCGLGYRRDFIDIRVALRCFAVAALTLWRCFALLPGSVPCKAAANGPILSQYLDLGVWWGFWDSGFRPPTLLETTVTRTQSPYGCAIETGLDIVIGFEAAKNELLSLS